MNERGTTDRGVLRILHQLESGLMTTLMVAMILMAFGQIVLRNIFEVSILWADPFLRHLVLWTGMLGAAMATRDGRHIKIDFLPQLMPPRGKAVLAALTNLFSAGVCTVLVWAAVRFVRDELEFGGTAFLDIPAWIVQLILPVAFVIITIRFFIFAFTSARSAWRNDADKTFGEDAA
jgi:TRAP-type C4-dicarboxylate transport system permease small subunit